MGFSGDLIWKVAAEVGNFTEVQGQIPLLSPPISIRSSGA